MINLKLVISTGNSPSQIICHSPHATRNTPTEPPTFNFIVADYDLIVACDRKLRSGRPNRLYSMYCVPTCTVCTTVHVLSLWTVILMCDKRYGRMACMIDEIDEGRRVTICIVQERTGHASYMNICGC